MDNKIKTAFDALHMDADCSVKITAAFTSHTTGCMFSRSFYRFAFAACLCIILPITVLGIEMILPGVKLGNQSVTDDMSTYRTVADLIPRPAEHFSNTLQSDLHSGTLRQVFHDKNSLESYIGFDIAQSEDLESAAIVADLDEAFKYGFTLRPQFAVDTSARYILTSCDLDGNYAIKNPDALKVSSHRVFMNTEVYLDAWIILECATAEDIENGMLGENFPRINGFTMEMVYDDNGSLALDSNGEPIATLTPFSSSEYEFDESVYTMANGNIATIITSRFREPDGSYGIYEYMGYFVQNGILYSVRPYAIYNPEENFPSLDKDCLTVLKAALDTFD